jgi:transcriptional regulator with XRE-family HTH domain
MGWLCMVPENGLLRGQREKLGLTQEEVAKKAGIKLEQYQRYEEIGVNISSSSMRIVNAVLTALELDPTSFANGDYCLEPLPKDDPLNQLNPENNFGRDNLG